MIPASVSDRSTTAAAALGAQDKSVMVVHREDSAAINSVRAHRDFGGYSNETRQRTVKASLHPPHQSLRARGSR
jgi:hypothetical protein